MDATDSVTTQTDVMAPKDLPERKEDILQGARLEFERAVMQALNPKNLKALNPKPLYTPYTLTPKH